MVILQLQIIIIAWLVAVSAVLPGVFLVVRGLALMSDAISHALLLGIVIMFLWVKRLDSPLLLLGATAAGLLTVATIQWLIRIKYLKKDAAIGLVFPLFFSLGVILICRYARSVHIDTDMVLLGEIVFAPFNRLIVAGVDLGPYALWLMGSTALINLLLVTAFYKELLLTSFDEHYAHVIGYSPTIIYYLLMTMTSVTAVSAFDSAGSILLVALMITPPATAYMLSSTIKQMIGVSVGISIVSVVLGYLFAHALDASIVGCIAVMTGLLFVLVLSYSSRKKIGKQNDDLPLDGRMPALLSYYVAEQTTCNAVFVSHLAQKLAWSPQKMEQEIAYAIAQEYIIYQQGLYTVTERGRKLIKNAI